MPAVLRVSYGSLFWEGMGLMRLRGLSVALVVVCSLVGAPLSGGVALAAGPPGATSEAATGITVTTAILHGTVNHEALAEVIGCDFEWGTEEGVYPNTVACSPPAPFGASEPTVAVSAELTGLLQNQTYHYRLAASNENEATETETGFGQDKLFTTGAIDPTIDSTSAADVSSNGAEVRAQINPNGADTTYYFQYGNAEGSYVTSVPVPPGDDIGTARNDQSVSIHIRGLAQDVTYHYRVIAINSAGAVEGKDHIFTTQPSGGTFVLPDDRGYEMVSPLDKNGADIIGIDADSGGGVVQAATNGEKATYVSRGSFGTGGQGDPVGSQYISQRESDGNWSTQNITLPSRANSYPFVGFGTPYHVFSPSLSQGLISNGTAFLPVENAPLGGAPAGYANLYLHDNNDGSIEALLTSAPEGASTSSFDLRMLGSTPDLSHIVVESDGELSPGVNTAMDEWANGHFLPVSILPNGSDVQNTGVNAPAVLGSGRGESHTISDDGSHVFWAIGGEPVFARIDNARTVEIPGGRFLTASTDGSKVLMESGLVYDVDKQRPIVQLSSLNGAAGGIVKLVGASDDLSTIYFMDRGVLTGSNSAGKEPLSGEANLYVWQEGPGEGTATFIATLSADDNAGGLTANGETPVFDWRPSLGERTTRVTKDGRLLVFMSDEPLTGFDNVDSLTGAPDEEVFEYSSASGLACVSCNPNGERPIGPSGIPPGTSYSDGESFRSSLYASRVLSSDGNRVFFDSGDRLVPQDTNGRVSGSEGVGVGDDVYEYENGRVYLISSGTSSDPSEFVDASENGDDVFFLTRAQLVPGDTDQLVDLYDARVGGGASVASSLECTGTGCQGVPAAPPIFATPSSVTFNGVGNFSAPTKPVVKGKTRKKTKPKKHKKKAEARKKSDKAKNKTGKSTQKTKGGGR